MSRSHDAGSLVRTALEEADRRERQARFTLLAAALLEAVLLALALYVMDFDDATHLLVFILAILVYTTLALALVAIASRSAAGHARLLHAIQLLDERLPAA